jgi:hypothetical protein
MWAGFLLCGAMFLGLVLAGVVAARALRASSAGAHDARHREVMCPATGEVALATLIRNFETGRWIDAAACSARLRERPLRCDRACVKLLNTPVTLPATHVRRR